MASRPLRVDAQRNRDRILQFADQAIARTGTIGSLDALARAAEVGVGTLYRHFPTREALIEAVYRGELDKLCAAADTLLRREPPDVALREWLDRFTDYFRKKQEMAEALRTVVASGADPFAQSRQRMVAAVSSLLAAGQRAGVLRTDVDPTDVFFSVAGIATVAGGPGQRQQAARLLDLLLDGLRPR